MGGGCSYSFGAGRTWLCVAGIRVDLPEGVYEVGDIRVRQTPADGQTSSVDGLFPYRLIVDETAPTLLHSSGLNGMRDVLIDTDLQLTFSEAIQRGNGDLVLTKTGGVMVARFAPNSLRAAIAGQTLTLDPAENLADGATYHLLFEPDAIRDAEDNPFLDPGDQIFLLLVPLVCPMTSPLP